MGNKVNAEEFKQMVEPLIQYMNDGEKFHPHMEIIITPTGAKLVEGVVGFTTYDFLKD